MYLTHWKLHVFVADVSAVQSRQPAHAEFEEYRHGVLVDTNLLVLLTVGAANRDRIATFKRTRQYSAGDFDLLSGALRPFLRLTVPQVLAEASNLVDLPGPELLVARAHLRGYIELAVEVELRSRQAANESSYPRLGLTDAAIAMAARQYGCTVLTDDLDLYLQLSTAGLSVENFTHTRRRYL
jgi:predicted nucleic acid-binding protein